jgi:hypothetical protein
MALRKATGRIVAGHGEDRQIITRGMQFDTEDFGIDDEQLAKLDAAGVVQRVAVEPVAVPRAPAPRAAHRGRPRKSAHESDDDI